MHAHHKTAPRGLVAALELAIVLMAVLMTAVDVRPAAAAGTKLGIVRQQNVVVAGSVFLVPPVVAVQNASGATDTTDNATPVTLSLASGGGTGVLICTGGLTVTAASGLATFDGCTVSAPGWYALQATTPSMTTAPDRPFTAISAAKLSAGGAHTCMVTPAGHVQCWGWNYYGQLGDGTTVDRAAPVTVLGIGGAGSLSGVVGVSAGERSTCALLADGRVRCWGDNMNSQLGTGFTCPQVCPNPTPAAVLDASGSELNGVVAIDAGDRHNCALTAAGGVKCWGDNFYGQLGDGSNQARTRTTEVFALGAVGVTAGHGFSCSALESGAVVCWGRNGDGELGDGTTANRNAPVGVLDPTTVPTSVILDAVAVSAGGNHACALTFGGGVKCWGASNFLATDGSGYTQVSAGVDDFSCGVANPGGAALCWGKDEYGQLGDGSPLLSKALAVSVSGLTGVTELSAGWTHACAMLPTLVECWGSNASGQLGDNGGSASSSAVPVTVDFPLAPSSQSIAVGSSAPTAAVVGVGAYAPTATASSGLPVTITVDAASAAVCTMNGVSVTFLTPGTCKIDFNQSGNVNYLPAPQAQQSFAVTAPDSGGTTGAPGFTFSCASTVSATLPKAGTVSVSLACGVVGGNFSPTTPITLSCVTPLPAGISCTTFLPNPIYTGATYTSVLTLAVGPTAIDKSTFTVQAVAGKTTQKTTVTFRTPPPKDIIVRCDRTSFRMPLGGVSPTNNAPSTCTVAGVNLAQSEAISLACINPPDGVSCDFSPSAGASPFTSLLTLQIDSSRATNTGSTPFSLRATSASGVQRLYPLQFALTPAAPLPCDASPTVNLTDGLPDAAKLYGVMRCPVTGAPATLVDLPAMLAQVGRRDIYVQLDWMAGPNNQPGYYKLSQDALCMVQAAFRARNIYLRIDQGPDSLLDCVTGLAWGDLSRAQEVPYYSQLGGRDSSDPTKYDWTVFEYWKQRNFTTTGRTPYQHYVISMNEYDTASHSSGLSRGMQIIGSSDFIVSLGSYKDPVAGRGGGTVIQQAGTFMHELGHNLTLDHGGLDAVNYKPNYLSVMNYAFQFGGIIKGNVDGTIDYSGDALGTLVESSLSESGGLKTSAGATLMGYGTRHYCPGLGNVGVYDTSQGIDWNCSGTPTTGSLSVDVNGDGSKTNLPGFNDWVNLQLKVGLVGDAAGISLPMATTIDEATLADLAATPPLLPPAQALEDAIRAALGNGPESKAFLSQAAAISSAPNANAKAGKLQAFIDHVNAQTGKALTPLQAAQFIYLARLL